MPKPAMLRSFNDQLAESFIADLDAVAERIAAEAGQPAGTRPLSEAKKLERWGLQDPLVADDPEYFAQTLMQTGIPEEQAQHLIVVQENPDLLAGYVNPAGEDGVVDPEVADALTRIAEFPFRFGIWNAIDDPDEQVKECNRLEAKWNRLHPEASRPEPAPEMPPMQGAGAPLPPPAEPMMPMGG